MFHRKTAVIALTLTVAPLFWVVASATAQVDHSGSDQERVRLQVRRSVPDPEVKIVVECPDHNDRFSQGNWRSIGPERFVLGREGHYGGLGRINTLAMDPTNAEVIYAGAAAGALWKTTDSGSHWQALTDAYGVSGIAIHPTDHGTIYVLTGDGDGYGGSAYYVKSHGVLKSIDGGENWQFTCTRGEPECFGGFETFFGYDMKIVPNQEKGQPEILVAATDQGLFKTSDGGETWTKVYEGYFYDIEFHPQHSSILYASAQYEIVRSKDGGESWESCFDLLQELKDKQTLKEDPVYPRIELAVTEADPDLVYALVGAYYPDKSTGGLIGLYRWHETEGSWELRSTTPNILGYAEYGGGSDGLPWYMMDIDVSPNDKNEIWVGGVVLWKSTDGGATWMPGTGWDQRNPHSLYRAIHVDVHDLDYTSHGLFAATDGGVYMKVKQMDSWLNLSAGLEVTQIYKICGHRDDSEVFYIGTQDNGANRLRRRVAAQVFAVWEFGDAMVCLVHPNSPEIVYVSGQRGQIYKSQDGGETFLSVTAPGSTTIGSGDGLVPWITPFAMHPDDPETIYGCYAEVWVTRNGGRTWSQISEGQDLGERSYENRCAQIAATSVKASGTGPSYIYVAKSGGVYRSIDKSDGEKPDWMDITADLPVNLGISNLAVNPTNPDEAWVTFLGNEQDKKIFKGRPCRGNVFYWENVSGADVLPNVPVRAIIFADDDLGSVYIGMDCGVYYRNAELTEWISFNKGLRARMITDLLIQRDRGRDRDRDHYVIRAGTFSWGAWESPVYPVPEGR